MNSGLPHNNRPFIGSISRQWSHPSRSIDDRTTKGWLLRTKMWLLFAILSVNNAPRGPYCLPTIPQRQPHSARLDVPLYQPWPRYEVVKIGWLLKKFECCVLRSFEFPKKTWSTSTQLELKPTDLLINADILASYLPSLQFLLVLFQSNTAGPMSNCRLHWRVLEGTLVYLKSFVIRRYIHSTTA